MCCPTLLDLLYAWPMTASASSHKLYSTLASWWPVLSAPEDYGEEADFFCRLLSERGLQSSNTVLELGSGGGNNASHLKAYFTMTLVDLSPGMLDVSRTLNPECQHVQGDMRTVRLGQTFDAVFVHDAVAYMTTEEDLRQALTTAFVHCKPGGVALFVPDHLKETYEEETSQGGHDLEGRSLRYLEWCWDPDPDDTTCVVDYVYLLRDGVGEVRVEHDHHVVGLFSRDDWLRLLHEVGFVPETVPFVHSEVEAGKLDVFIGHKPAG